MADNGNRGGRRGSNRGNNSNSHRGGRGGNNNNSNGGGGGQNRTNKMGGGRGRSRKRGGSRGGSNGPYSRGGRNRGKSSPGGGGGGNNSEFYKISIFGIAQGVAQAQLLAFLGKTGGKFRGLDVDWTDKGKAFFFVRTEGEANNLKSVDGTEFMGKSLSIRVRNPQPQNGNNNDGGGGGSNNNDSGKNSKKNSKKDKKRSGGALLPEHEQRQLALFLETKYNAASKFLNLSALTEQAQLNGLNARLDNRQFTDTLMKLISRRVGDVEVLSLDNNSIKNLYALSELSSHAPGVSCISLRDNNISSHSDLDPLTGYEHLREIVLIGNPLQNNARDFTSYKSEITRRFPELEMLDGTSVMPMIRFNVPSYLAKPKTPTIGGSFFEAPNRENMVSQFINDFFTLYDTDRATLLNAYVPDTSFYSYTVERDFEGGGGSGGNKQRGRRNNKNNSSSGAAGDSLEMYGPTSRNLSHVLEFEKRNNRLYVGNIEILAFIMEMPATRHAISDFVVDSYGLRGCTTPFLTIQVHGHFWEEDAAINRSFDRTFTVVMSSSPSAQWPLTIVNDMLHIREYSATGRDPLAPVATSTHAPTTTSTGAIGGARMGGSSMASGPTTGVPSATNAMAPAAMEANVRQLAAQTGLTLEASMGLLQQCQWSPSVALQQFHKLNAQGAIAASNFAQQ